MKKQRSWHCWYEKPGHLAVPLYDCAAWNHKLLEPRKPQSSSSPSSNFSVTETEAQRAQVMWEGACKFRERDDGEKSSTMSAFPLRLAPFGFSEVFPSSFHLPTATPKLHKVRRCVSYSPMYFPSQPVLYPSQRDSACLKKCKCLLNICKEAYDIELKYI